MGCWRYEGVNNVGCVNIWVYVLSECPSHLSENAANLGFLSLLIMRSIVKVTVSSKFKLRQM